MKYLLTMMALFFAVSMATPTYAGEPTKSHSGSGWIDLDLGPKCDNWNILSFGFDSEESCVTQHQTYQSSTTTKSTIDATTVDIITKPILVPDGAGGLKPIMITDADGNQVPLAETTNRTLTDARGYYGSLGRGSRLSLSGLFQWLEDGATAASAARAHVLGSGAQYISQGHGEYLAGASGSPYQGPTVTTPAGDRIGAPENENDN